MIEALDPKPNENFIDCTFGWGGHSLAILEKTAPEGRILGIERDAQSLAGLCEEIKQNPRLIIVNDSYVNIAAAAKIHNFENVSGILMDLGMSSWHVDQSGKGFSFAKDEPLDMRYDSSDEFNAADVINDWQVKDLEKIFKDLGQDAKAKKIAQAIGTARKIKSIETAARLAQIVKMAAPKGGTKSLARIFQALRICVNHEFENIKQGIAAGFEIVKPGGRIVAITFHSGEDKIVKTEFRELVVAQKASVVFKKPVVCGVDEMAKNPRARSAKLRAIEKII